MSKRKHKQPVSNEQPNCIVEHQYSYALHFHNRIEYYSKDGIHLSTKELNTQWINTNNAQWNGSTGWINFYFTLTGTNQDKDKKET